MSNDILLTIVVPVYNRRKMVVHTLDSIAASEDKRFELIVVDNGSSDGSLEECHRWAEEHEADGFTIHVLEEKTPGAAKARNRGLSACHTPYIYFFDSDDWFSNDFVGDISTILLNHSDAGHPDMVFIPVREQTDDNYIIRPYRQDNNVSVQILSSMLNTVSMVFSTDWLRQIGGWDSELRTWDDWELGIRAMLNKPQIHWACEKAYHKIKIHPESLTGPSFTSRFEFITKAMQHALNDIRSLGNESVAALYLHSYITAGKIAKEGSHELSAEMRRWADADMDDVSFRHKFVAKCLFLYTRCGGRGAWRIALTLI